MPCMHPVYALWGNEHGLGHVRCGRRAPYISQLHQSIVVLELLLFNRCSKLDYLFLTTHVYARQCLCCPQSGIEPIHAPFYSIPLTTVTFNKTAVSAECLVGKEGDGLAVLNSGLDLLRLWLAAVSDGL